MQWMDTLRHLIHTIGWNGNSRMTDITWKYAIQQAFKLSQIHYLPGSYNNRLSYNNLTILTYEEIFQENRPTNSIMATPTPNRILAADILGFELPFNKFNLKPITPPLLENIFQQFLTRSTPKHASQSLETERKLQSLAKSVFDQFNLSEPWDVIIVVTALTLSRRKPLPMQDDNLRDRQWVDLVTRRRSPTGDMQTTPYGNAAEFCLSFLVTAMVKRYPQLQTEAHRSIIPLWEKRWGKILRFKAK
jgi:hypothetical protein